MKKRIIFLFSLTTVYNAIAGAIIIDDKATVNVKEKTLLYAGEGMTIRSSKPRTVINEGNILIDLKLVTDNKIDNKFNNFESNSSDVFNDGSNFINVYKNPNSYGQLMFINTNSPLAMNGKVTIEMPPIDRKKFHWYPIAFPFIQKSVNIIKSSFEGKITSSIQKDTGKQRYSTPYMQWDRENYYYYTDPERDQKLNYVDIYKKQFFKLLNLTPNSDFAKFFDEKIEQNKKVNLRGVPFSTNTPAVIEDVTLGKELENRGARYTDNDTWKEWSERKAPSGEKYKTFIGESFIEYNENSKEYGKWLTNIMNPYTHNFDLEYAFNYKFFQNGMKLMGVHKIGDASNVKWDEKQGNISENIKEPIKATVNRFNNGIIEWSGDKNALLLKPTEIATLKFRRNFRGTLYQFDLSDVDFVFTGLRPNNSYGTHKTFRMSSTKRMNRLVSTSSNSMKRSLRFYDDSDEINLYQLRLMLFHEDKTKYNNVYIAATKIKGSGRESGYSGDAAYNAFVLNPNVGTGIYLHSENEDGSYNKNSHLYISEIDKDNYIGKPVHVAFHKNKNDKYNKYTFKFEFAERTTTNDGLDKFSNGNKFYFVDTKQNIQFEIKKDSEYTFTENESTSDRFLIYWNQLPGQKIIKKNKQNIDNNKNNIKSIIYTSINPNNMDLHEYYIKFGNIGITANVNVYDTFGLNVFSKNNINVNNQKLYLGLGKEFKKGVYIVNIEYNNAKKETLKFIVN